MYGLLVGHRTSAKADVIAYSIEHVLIDSYAKSSRAWAYGSLPFLRSSYETIERCWPWLHIVGDVHSHPYPGRDRLPGVTGMSNDDRIDWEKRTLLRGHYTHMRVFLVCSIHGQRGRRRKLRRNQLRWSLGEHRITLDAYIGIPAGPPGRIHIVPRHSEWPKMKAHQLGRFVAILQGASYQPRCDHD